MTNAIKILNLRMIIPVLLLALIAWPQGVQAQLGGAVVDVTSGVVDGPYTDTVTVGDGVELQEGDGSNVGDNFFGPGDSIDIGQSSVTITLGDDMQGGFKFTNLDGPLDRDILALNLTGNLSSESHLAFDNATATATLTIDCNKLLDPPQQCLGGTLVLDIVFAPIGGGDPIEAITELKDAVIAQAFDPETEEKLTRRLDTAIRRLENGNTEGAISRLEGFNQKVERGQETGAIGQAVGDALIANANDIIALIQV